MAATLVLCAVALLRAGLPRDVSFVATHDQSEQRYVLVLPGDLMRPNPRMS
ncbi:MAG: hypothetical protein M5U12_22420 [Verrucomicrobia bacterium]|nr:hypothetical protein [Verrucomicrobiota bacterium]